MNRGPIIIGGLSRSGKTLMRALLASHPNIAIPTKGSNMWAYFYRRHGDLSQCENLERCLAAMLRYKHVLSLNPNPDRIRDKFWQGEPTYARLFALFHIHYAEHLNKPRWGCQSGLIERYADLILTAYPFAKVIHMIRDPRDRYTEVAARWPHMRKKVGVSTSVWIYSVGLAKRNQKRYPDRYELVRYETLVSQPEETLCDICTFLGEDYTPRMLLMESAEGFRDAGGNKPDCTDRQGNVSSAFIGCYRQKMSKREIAFVQTHAKRHMIAHHYELDPVQLSLSDRMLAYFVDQPVHLTQMVGWRIEEAIRLGFPARMGRIPWPDKIEQNLEGN